MNLVRLNNTYLTLKNVRDIVKEEIDNDPKALEILKDWHENGIKPSPYFKEVLKLVDSIDRLEVVMLSLNGFIRSEKYNDL